MYPDVFDCATFSFRIKKISTSTRIRIQIEFARPQVSGGFVERLRSTFTPNGRRKFVPRDQVSPLFSVYSLLLPRKNK